MDVNFSESTNGTRKNDSFHRRPVPPNASGKGLPYAPVDWPSPGDIWTWKVGTIVGASGYYSHRFLIVPERLRKNSRKIYLGSKPAVTRFLQSEFPSADINAFFASFTWKIPSDSTSKAKVTSTPYPVVKRTRKSARERIGQKAQGTTIIVDLTLSPDRVSSDTTDNESGQIFDAHVDIGSEPNAVEMTSEDFDSYVNSLDELLCWSVPNASNLRKGEFNKARGELSSFLAMDFQNLITSDIIQEITDISSELQSDPQLTPDEISVLNLIREIPSASKHFLDAKQVTGEASKFFQVLEANITVINALKTKYLSSKDQLALVQAEHASATSSIQELDEKIAMLQSLRDKFAEVVKRNQKKIAELAATKKQVSDSIPKIVSEVQIAKTEISEWELKRKQAANQEAEILAKFAPLKGFSFMQ